ncbi:hypothetical protein [Polyangium sp. y55x31]|uniref:hypothetical protein n=1 Tax=Polyangium sp. y55x31 TaxID=3042688 RepID=UPI0024826D9E|nr:hypothetical protein [Polyangium sp. y55x31]MDI1478670.1 hypothetical protein [Polyangium sp. y55x31]
MTRRFGNSVNLSEAVIAYTASKIIPQYTISGVGGRELELQSLSVGTVTTPYRVRLPAQIDSHIARRVLEMIRSEETILTRETITWAEFVAPAVLETELATIRRKLAPPPGVSASSREAFRRAAERESVIAGVLSKLYQQSSWDILSGLFFPKTTEIDYSDLSGIFTILAEPEEEFAIDAEINRAVLSPVGIIHLFRQYFFEFDSFLGPSIQHVWLSPGAVVELVESHARRVQTERFTEISSESSQKTEESVTDTDEISDAIKDENTNNTKLGVSANIDAGLDMEIFSAHASANVGYGFDNTQKKAREQLHKQTRAQSSKVTNEIKRNHKTSLRTVTETTDVSSKRYVLTNNTSALVNYELRRKMRQVGVQLQDMGTQLCWQAYVDDPGLTLGVAELVHIAEPADLANLPLPQAPVYLEPKVVETTVKFDYERADDSEGSEMDVTFYEGSDEEGGTDNNDKIVWQKEYDVSPPQHGYWLESVQVTPLHSAVCVAEPEVIHSGGKFKISLKQVNFNNQPSINLAVKLNWNPPDQKALEEQFNAELASHEQEKSRLAKEAFIKAARERVRLASSIEARNSVELREEERVVVYRKLIEKLLDVGVDLKKNPTTRHLMSELVSALFDVDKMLYFVAPEWWSPRAHPVKQSLGAVQGPDGTKYEKLTPDNAVSWGGSAENLRDANYYITEDSRPAKLGSSLGWLLQLDGDTMRNAFLNAPWVKAVIPIRPGKELDALKWLKNAAVEGADGLDALYQEETAGEKDAMATVLKDYTWPDPADEARYDASFTGADVTIEDALRYLAIEIAQKHADANVKTAGVMPLDKVYDNGFDPLTGGFEATPTTPYQVFDQWVEVLPTDQLVAVQVEYDPVTGRLVTPPAEP